MKTEEESRQRDIAKNYAKTVYWSFWIIEVLVNICIFLSVTAAQDILAGTEFQTSVVLLSVAGPCTGVVLLAPSFIKWVPYVIRFIIVFVGATLSFVVLGLTSVIQLKIVALVTIGVSAGIADLTAAGLTSYFNPLVLAAYSAGSGAGMILSPLYYTAMTTWFCVSPGKTLLFIAPIFLLFIICYYIIQKEITGDKNNSSSTRQEIHYAKIQSSDDEDEDSTKRKETQRKAQMFSSGETLTWKEKLLAIKKILIRVAIPVFVSWFSEYLFLQSVITTVAYPNAPFSPRDHYEYYVLLLLFGEVLGRSHRSLIGLINSKWLYVPTVKGLWALTLIIVLYLLLAFLESWYRFLPGVGIFMVLCLSLGIFVGVMFANYLELSLISVDEKEREFVMAWALAPNSSGSTLAAFIGLYVEPRLRDHCIASMANSVFCFTRPSRALKHYC